MKIQFKIRHLLIALVLIGGGLAVANYFLFRPRTFMTFGTPQVVVLGQDQESHAKDVIYSLIASKGFVRVDPKRAISREGEPFQEVTFELVSEDGIERVIFVLSWTRNYLGTEAMMFEIDHHWRAKPAYPASHQKTNQKFIEFVSDFNEELNGIVEKDDALSLR